MKICIIGCGTYGSYLLRRLLETCGDDARITVVEVGNDKTQSGAEIGIGAESPASQAPHHGRYFGMGGTSARWGGQILFFDERDNPRGDPDWAEIVSWNRKHRHRVVASLLGSGVDADTLMDDAGDVKTGIWLKYGKRNLYKQVDTKKRAGVEIFRDLRVADFEADSGTVRRILCVDRAGNTHRIEADRFYLTAGAFESCRLLLASRGKAAIQLGALPGRNYGDHISAELFAVKGRRPVMGGVDFLPRFFRGSLITKRIVVRTRSGRVGFVHFIFNKDVKVFSDLKSMLFGRKKFRFRPWALLSGLGFLFRFFFDMLVRRRLYARDDAWSLQLDLEQAYPNGNGVELSAARDGFGQPLVRVDWRVSDEDRAEIEEIKGLMSEKLAAEGIPTRVVHDPADVDSKIEDTYHPFGMIRMGSDPKAVVDMDFRIRGTDNLFHFSTAMFPGARSINPTAAGFCLIEEHLERFGIAGTRSKSLKVETIENDAQ